MKKHNNRLITVVEFDKPTGKTFTFDRSLGKITKQAAAHSIVGKAVTKKVESASDLLEIIKVTHRQQYSAIILGFFPSAELGEPFRIVSSKRFKQIAATAEGYNDPYFEVPIVSESGEKVVRRSKKTFSPSAWLCFDRDAVDAMPKELKPNASSSEWWDMMTDFLPMLGGSERLHVGSSTSRVVYLNKPCAANNEHVFVLTNDAKDVQRFGMAALVHAVNEGYGFNKPVSGGGSRLWSIFDPTTFSHERLYFESCPQLNIRHEDTAKLINAGWLDVVDASVKLVEGEPVDTSKLRTPTVEDQKNAGLKLNKRGATLRPVDSTNFSPDTMLHVKDDYNQEYHLKASDIFRGITPLGDTKRFRCQSPFRHDSQSWAAYVSTVDGEGKDIHPHLFDVGTGIKYVYNDVVFLFEEAFRNGTIKKAINQIKKEQTPKVDEKPPIKDNSPTPKPQETKEIEPETTTVTCYEEDDDTTFPDDHEYANSNATFYKPDDTVIHASVDLDDRKYREFAPKLFTSVHQDDDQMGLAMAFLDCYYSGACLIKRGGTGDLYHRWTGRYWDEVTEEELRADVSVSFSFAEVETLTAAKVSSVMKMVKDIAVMNARHIVDAPQHHISCLNGVYDISLDRLLPFKMKYFYTSDGIFNYDPSATGLMDGLISQYSQGERNWKRKIVQMIGYLLAGGRNTEEKMMLFNGASRSGKSLIADSLNAIIGKTRINTISIGQLIEHKHFAPNHYSNMIYDDDCVAPVGADYKKFLGVFKKVCSGATFKTEQLYTSKRIESDVNIKMLGCSNGVPNMPDISGATMNRIELIEFSKSFSENPDTSLKRKLESPKELSATFNLFLLGYRDWVECGSSGFPKVESSEREIEIEKRSNNPVFQFLEFAINREPSSFASLAEIMDVFPQWQRSNTGGALRTANVNMVMKNIKTTLVSKGFMFKDGGFHGIKLKVGQNFF